MRKLLIALFSFVAFQCKASERAQFVYGAVKILKKSAQKKVSFKDVVYVGGHAYWHVSNSHKNLLGTRTKIRKQTHKSHHVPEKAVALVISDLVSLNTATDGLVFIDPDTGNYIE